MAFWDIFRKKKKEPVVQEQGLPTLAGIPVYDEHLENPITMGGIAPDPEPLFVSPPPYQPDAQELASGLPMDIIPEEPERSFAPSAVFDGESGNEPKAYSLTFYLMENNVCTTKIDYTCYDYEQPADILQRLQKDGRLLRLPVGFDYRILYWPTKDGMSTVDQLDNSEPKRISEFDPKPDSVFIIQQFRTWEAPLESEPMYPLYGCPTAAMPEQENILRNSSVDTVAYD